MRFGVGWHAAISTRHPLLVKVRVKRESQPAGCFFWPPAAWFICFFSDSYWVSYVVSHSNRDLATFYKIAALWYRSGGSYCFFWSFLLAIYVISRLLVYRNKTGELMPYVGVVLAGVQIFFLTTE